MTSENRNDWTDKAEFLAGKPAITHRHTKETALAGKHGEIWSASPTMFSCVVTDNIVANKIAKRLGCSGGYAREDEALLHFSSKFLDFVMKKLEIPYTRKEQIKHANSFGCGQGINQSEKVVLATKLKKTAL